MAKSSRRASSNKRLQSLIRSQRMNELMKIGGVQSQALLDSAGESRPSDESHVVELLDTERFTRTEMARARPRMRRAKARPRRKPARKAASKSRKRKRR